MQSKPSGDPVGRSEEARLFDAYWPTVVAGLCGTALGALGTVFAAFINRKPALAAVVDTRIRVLIEAYERTIGELRSEIGKLEAKIDVYEKTIGELRDHVAKLEIKVDVLNKDLREAGSQVFL
jgi:septal ring factor EnvC (AmiA/AmiB activator)